MEVTLLSSFEDKSIGNVLAEGISEALNVRIAVAYGSYMGFKSVQSSLNEVLRRNGKVRAVFDTQSFMTTPEVIEEFATIPGNSRCKVYGGALVSGTGDPNPAKFHPKIYILDKANYSEVIIGSSNFTDGGLTKNIEVNAQIRCETNDPFMEQVSDYWNRVWNNTNAYHPTDEFLRSYRELFDTHRPSIDSSKADAQGLLEKLITETLIGPSGSDGVLAHYLAGLFFGAGKFSDEPTPADFKIVFRSIGRESGTNEVGVIAAPGITEYTANQADAMAEDAAHIYEVVSTWLEQTNQGTVTLTQKSLYHFEFQVQLDPDSYAHSLIEKCLSSGEVELRRFVPDFLPDWVVERGHSFFEAFVRGYFDVRGRISVADRAGTTGPLRIALSVSSKASTFGEQLKDALLAFYKMEHINFLDGSTRKKETMIRMEAQEAPSGLFTSSWQRLMHEEFKKYNINHFARDSSSQPRLLSF